MEFIRFAGTINTHEEKKVAKSTVNVILEDCTGTFYITDVVKDDIDLVPFQRYGWSGRMVIDRKEHITYIMMRILQSHRSVHTC